MKYLWRMNLTVVYHYLEINYMVWNENTSELVAKRMAFGGAVINKLGIAFTFVVY